MQSNDFCLTAASVEDLVADFQISSTGQSEIVLQFNDTAADSKFQILANSQVSQLFRFSFKALRITKDLISTSNSCLEYSLLKAIF